MDNFEIQRRLKAHGFDPGPIDGVIGPMTNKAIVAFKKSRKLRARPYIGDVTRAALRQPPKEAKFTKPFKPAQGMPPWLRNAYRYLGLKEIPGKRHNKEIVSWWEALNLHFRDDETPWCAGFVNRMVQMCGLSIPDKYRAAALGWRWQDHGTRIKGPALGCIVDMQRPGRPGSGHQAICAGRDRHGNLQLLGGNQGNAVSINPYKPGTRKMQYRWPPGHDLPARTGIHTLPVINKSGARLKNEA